MVANGITPPNVRVSLPPLYDQDISIGSARTLMQSCMPCFLAGDYTTTRFSNCAIGSPFPHLPFLWAATS